MVKENEKLTVKHMRELWEKDFCPLFSLELSRLKNNFNRISFKIIPSLKTKLKHAYLHRSIDVKLIFDSARLGLFSSANILQIADVALRVVFLLFLPCF